MVMFNGALYLDSDGVVHVDHRYVYRPEQFEFIPGIFPLAPFWASELRAPIIVMSNHFGTGRGYFDDKSHADVTLRSGTRGDRARLSLPLSPQARHWRISLRSSVAQVQFR
jgi:hypothetical protein